MSEVIKNQEKGEKKPPVIEDRCAFCGKRTKSMIVICEVCYDEI